ncbi:MAG TPA: glycosyltransferase family 39 protein [Gemmatimonadota bacterium]|nr:glycosyltransferase family 39 protein [Gemmatimonadota bacterium]
MRWGGRPLVPLLLLAATCLLWQLGAYGLWESTEARYAEIAARMVRSGDWMTPRLNYIAHFDKPPLTYWVTGAGMLALGLTELGARIGLVAAALAILVVVHRWTAEVRGERAAAYAFLCLLSAPLFFALARSVTTDLYLTLWVVLAIDAGRRGSRPGAARGWRLLAWAALGAGFMTKGPVVLLWTALPAAVWAGWTGSWRRLGRLADPWGFLFTLAIALPWYLGSLARHPALLDFWLGRQTVGRVLAPYEGEREPLWTYLLVMAWAAGAWVFPAAIEIARGARRRVGGEARRRGRRGERAPYLLFWVLVPLAAFSLFPTKRANYLLPVLPAVAIAAGAWWARAGEGTGAVGVSRVVAAATALLGAGLFVAGSLVDGVRASLPEKLVALGWSIGPVFVLGGAAAWLAAGRRRFDLAFAGCLIPLLGLYLAGYTALADPRVESHFKISRPLARAAAAHHTGEEPIVAYHAWPRALPFYLDRRLITVTGAGRETAFEDDPRWRRYVFTADTAFYRMARGDRRALFVIPRGEHARIEARLGAPLTVLAATRRELLVTNRPSPSERDRVPRPVPALRAPPR